jgi:hypothetical protein
VRAAFWRGFCDSGGQDRDGIRAIEMAAEQPLPLSLRPDLSAPASSLSSRCAAAAPAPFCGDTTFAAAYDRSRARAYGNELIVQGRDGRIRTKDSYRTVPNPPSDRAAVGARPLALRRVANLPPRR